ncbi:MAG: alpha/beta fold hydrolase [Beijerinckiaceae bacterium]
MPNIQLAERITPAPASTAQAVEPWARPVAFEGCFGYLHPAGGDVGIVVCAPWAYEALCAHRALAEFAESLAANGYPTLRFDYPGAGNSRGDLAARSVEDWVASVSSAVETLRRHSNARRIVLAGLGFGCLVALAAAKAGLDVAGLLLLAPPQSGRRHQRETQAFAAMVATPGDGSDSVEQGAVSIAGFVLPAAFLAQARSLDATQFSLTPTSFAIVAAMPDRDSQPVVDALGAKGALVEQTSFDGYAELLASPIVVAPPRAAFARVVDALTRLCPSRGPVAAPIRQWPAASLVDGEIVEEALRFGEGGRLFGVICRPRHSREGVPAVVLIGSGRNVHTGWRRIGVDMARSLARKGIASLRFDLGGIGESAERPGQPAQILYSDWPQLDVTDAIDLMAARNFGAVTLAGICSGAYVALQSAIADARVKGLAPVNLFRVVWNPDDSFEEELRFGNRHMGKAVGSMFTRARLAKVLTGEFDVRPGLRRICSRIGHSMSVTAMRTMGAVGPRGWLYAEAMRRFEILKARNVATTFAFSEGDAGIADLESYFGRDARELVAFPNVRVSKIYNCDHNFTPPHAGEWLVAQVEDVVSRTVS